MLGLDQAELRDLVGILAVVREVVPVGGDALDGRNRGHAGDEQRDHPGRIGLQGQVDQVVHQARAADRVGGAEDVPGLLGRHLGLRFLGPFLAADQPLLQFADGSEVIVEFLAVVLAEVRLHAFGVVAARCP